MNKTLRIVFATTLAGLLGFSSASFASAEDADVELEASVTVQSTTTRPKSIQPLIELRKEARDRLIELREGMEDRRIEIRTEIREATSSEDRRDAIEQAREEREEMRDRAKEIRGNVKDRIEALVKSHIGAVMKRSENAISMFDNIMDRMESRIEKLQEAGADTTSVETSLSASATLVASAETDLRALESLIDSVEDTSDVDSVKTQLRAGILKLTASIKAAHASLLETSRALASLSASVTTESDDDANDD